MSYDLKKLESSGNRSAGDHGDALSPGKRTLTESLPAVPHGPAAAPATQTQAQSVAAVQRRDAGAETGDVHAAAAHGLTAPTTPLPHRHRIQDLFGPRHDISGIRAHMGDTAVQATRAMGAEAFATGNDVVFSQEPTLFTAAHEYVHPLQQQRGVALSGGVGKDGDIYERQADAVAERVVAGQSATDLLDQFVGGGAGGQAAVQATSSGQVQQAPRDRHSHRERRNAPLAPVGRRQDLVVNNPAAEILSVARSLQILQDTYGTYRQFTAQSVILLDQNAFVANYDSIYGPGAWGAQFGAGARNPEEAGAVDPHAANGQGLEYQGTMYINTTVAGSGVVPHEIMHANASGDFAPLVGREFNEAATEYMSQAALTQAGVPTRASSIYEPWMQAVHAFINVAGGENLYRAYFQGNTQGCIVNWVDQNCQGTWQQVRDALATNRVDWAVYYLQRRVQQPQQAAAPQQYSPGQDPGGPSSSSQAGQSGYGQPGQVPDYMRYYDPNATS